jgi:galactonate dehydratase
MKITDLKTFVVGNPPPSFGGRYFIFLKLATDNGIEGVGEVYADTFGPHVMAQMVKDVFERHVLGMDPFRIETLWRRVYGTGYTLRPDISLMGVLSGIEMALWDINGKAVNKPVYELLGGKVHERLRSYTYIYPEGRETDAIYHDAEMSASRAAEYVKQGFTAVKFDPAAPYSVFDPRQPSQETLACSERTASSPRPAPFGSPSGSSPTIRYGWRSRRRRKCRRRWRWWRARPPYP